MPKISELMIYILSLAVVTTIGYREYSQVSGKAYFNLQCLTKPSSPRTKPQLVAYKTTGQVGRLAGSGEDNSYTKTPANKQKAIERKRLLIEQAKHWIHQTGKPISHKSITIPSSDLQFQIAPNVPSNRRKNICDPPSGKIPVS